MSLLETRIQEPANRKQEGETKNDYKTPQELFSSFNAPNLSQTTTATTTSCGRHEKQDNNQSKPQTTQPSNVNPPPPSSKSTKFLPQTHLKLTSSFPAMQPSKMIPSGVQTVSSTGKPLLVQGHTSAPPPFYYMNQAGANGYIGYQAPFTPTNAYQPGLYGISSPFMDTRYFYPPTSAPTTAPMKKEPNTKEIKVLDPSQSSTTLRQSCAAIQGQMAANQIPLCLVQDAQGQLHQLVYTVPEEMYDKYMVAAKKGFKVRVGGDSLKLALSNGNNNTRAPTSSEEEKEHNYPKKLYDEDLKLVKDIKPKESNSYKEEIVVKESESFPLDNKETNEESIQQNENPSQEVKSNNNSVIHKTVIDKSPNEPIGDCSKSSITKELMSIILKSRTNKTNNMKNTTQEKKVALINSLSEDKRPFDEPVKIDLTGSSHNAVGDRCQTEPHSKDDLQLQPTHHHHQNNNITLNKTQNVDDTTIRREQPTDNDDTSDASKQSYHQSCSKQPNDNIITTITTTKTTTKDSSNNIEECKELHQNINTIDSILARNKNDLIPKSDVEALLRCLKRKLEETDIADTLDKHDKRQRSEERKDKNRLNPFHIKCNSYDFESSEMLSPESLPEENSPYCNSLFYSNMDPSSVSSVDSTNDKIIPSVTSSFDADSCNENETSSLFDERMPEIFGSETTKYDGDGPQSLTTLNNSQCESNNSSQHVDEFDFFDNLRDDLFANDTFIYHDVLPNTIPERLASNNNCTKMNTFDNDKNHKQSYGTEIFSFPSGQQNIDMDLFDHLWGEIDKL